jgi:RNA polymerase sigma-70 factor (ECF subfamily)
MKLLEEDEIETFSGLVKEHQAGLRAFVRALGVDDVWVDDLAQEAFLVAYRRRDDFDPEADFGKWLRGIARRLVANERRKAGRRSRLLHDSLTDLLMEAAPSEEPAAIRAPELFAAMQGCVAQLPPRSRELLHCRYSQGENAVQLAERLRMQADAVRQSLVRIRVAVKACIERKLEGAWL